MVQVIIMILLQKEKMLGSGEGLDWTTAEAFAFGSFLVQGNSVRLSGQDSGRGTFSQRHSVWTDQVSEERYNPLNNLRENIVIVSFNGSFSAETLMFALSIFIRAGLRMRIAFLYT